MLPEKQLQCSLCQQLFSDPVTTPCGHNFCRGCLEAQWDGSDACQCPACSAPFSPRPQMSVNVALKELADALKGASVCTAQPGEVQCDVCAASSLQVKAQKSCLVCLTSYCEAHLEPHRTVTMLKLHRLTEPLDDLQRRMCNKHERLLEMFCPEEQACVCQFCTETEHKEHQAVRIEEESARRKVQIEKLESDCQQMVQERLEKVEEIRSTLKLSTLSAEKELTESEDLFASLMRSAEERQGEVRAHIQEQQREAARRAEQLEEQLQQEVAELRRRSGELEELRSSDDHLHVLQSFPALMSPPPTRPWSEIQVHPELCPGTVRTSLSKLETSLRNKLQAVKTQEMKQIRKYAVDVLLDPDTAHPNIVLSADGKQAGRGELLHIVPDVPQRFDPVICVMGRRGFLSGRIYFQVNVGEKTFWDIGVVNGSVNRKGMITSKPENGFWTVRLRNGNEYRALDSPSVLLTLQDRPQTVGVFADYEAGVVSFFHVEARAHIYTFSQCSFSDKIFPFFSPGVCDEGRNKAPLIITDVHPET